MKNLYYYTGVLSDWFSIKMKRREEIDIFSDDRDYYNCQYFSGDKVPVPKSIVDNDICIHVEDDKKIISFYSLSKLNTIEALGKAKSLIINKMQGED